MSPLTKPFEGERIPLSTKIIFGMGDFFGGGSFTLMGIFYMFFMTDVVNLKPAYAGAIMLAAKLWDAVTDPIMGRITDATHSRWGRRRMYYIVGIAPIAVSFFLMWVPLQLESQVVMFIYFLIVQLFFRTVYTMVMVPYNAIIPELTTLYEERNNLSGIRGGMSTMSSLLSAVIPAMIIAQFTDKGVGHMAMAAIFGLFYSLPFIGVFFVTYERPEYQKSEMLPFWQSFKESMKNRSFKLLLGLYIFAYVSLDILMATFLYILTYILGKPNMGSTLLGIMLITQVLFLPLFVYLGNRISKSKALLIGLCLWAVMMAAGWFFTGDTPTTALYVYAFLLGISISPVGFMPWAILPDITDVDELMTGKRREGIYVGFMTFLRKISAGLALALLGFSLDIAKYDPELTFETQHESAVLAIRILFAIVPVVLIACSAYFSARFPLTGFAHKVCMNEVKRKRGEQYEDMGLTADEKHALLRSLVGPSYKPME